MKPTSQATGNLAWACAAASLHRRAVLALGLGAMLAGQGARAMVAKEAEMDSEEIFRVVKGYAEAWRRGDLKAIAAAYHDDFTLHYPGAHKLAGTHSGKAASLKVLGEVSRRTGRVLTGIVSVMAGEGHGAIVARERWTRGAMTADVERVLLYTVRDGQLAECKLYDADQETVARFLS